MRTSGWRLSVAVAALAGLGACGGDGGTTAPPTPVASVTVGPAQPVVQVGAFLQLSAVLKDADGNTLAGRTVAWASADPQVATISRTGSVVGVAPGTVEVSATSEGQTGTVSVAVTAPPVPVASVDVTALASTMTAGLTAQLTATPRDAGGAELTGRKVVWSTSDPNAATVSSGGLVTAEGAGQATITATVEGIHGAAATTVVVRFASISSAMEHTCALTQDGVAYCWGLDNQGQLGDGRWTVAVTPAPVRVQTTLRFTKIVAMGIGPLEHTCALTAAGALYCWGSNLAGELGTGGGDNSTTPVPVAPTLQFKEVAGGQTVTCALTTDGIAYCWGGGSLGQLGDGGLSNQYTTPHAVAGGLTFESIAASSSHVCALTSAGVAWCWGHNGAGQLGTGDQAPHSAPVAVQGGLQFSAISAAGASTCAITTGGLAYCWGFNGGGQLGVGDQADRLAPTAVSGGLTLAAITVGDAETCALASDGTGYCWGSYVGSLSPTPALAPVPIGGGLVWTSLSAAENGVCGIAEGPLAWCWGSDNAGQQGNGAEPSSLTPERVAYQP